MEETEIRQSGKETEETVPVSQVYKEAGVEKVEEVSDLRKLTATQQAGLWLAGAVGLAIGGVIVFVAVVWFQTAPPPPTLPPLPVITDPAKAKDILSNYQILNQAALDNYKALNTEAINRVTSLFDLFATKALIPIFTATIGYIFGSRAAAVAGNRPSE
ncbi:MAG: hypothetical protein ACRYFS_13125 [Janthinobacterium lividum]